MFKEWRDSCFFPFLGENSTGYRKIETTQRGISKHAQAGHWQTFPGREPAKHPRQRLQNVPRQGIGKRSQAGNWQASQTETANEPRQGLQTCPGRALADVPRQVTVNVPRQGMVVVLKQGTVGIAKEHCAKNFSNDLPPTPKVPLHRQPAACCVMGMLACLCDGGLSL